MTAVAGLRAGYALEGPALDQGQREVLAAALPDAIAHRREHADGECAGCDADPSLLCDEGAADLDLADAYLALARELGIEVDQ
jgi:hypothetical protein